jgi:replicative DNA helicase
VKMEEYGLYSLKAEQAVVGAIYLEEALIKECTILPEHLYSGRLRKLFSVMKELSAKGTPIDIISIMEEIGIENLESVGGVSYITDLAYHVPPTGNFRFYENTVIEYYQKRTTLQVANQIIEETTSGDISEAIRRGVTGLMAIEGGAADDDRGDINDTLVEMYRLTEMDESELVGVTSGFKELDALLKEGLKPSNFIVIGARPSVGKTAFALNLALSTAKQDVSIIFSLEMSKLQLLKRGAGAIGEINSFKMFCPKSDFEDSDWSKYTSAMGDLSSMNIRIFDRVGVNLNYIWSRVRNVKREFGEEKKILVVIDYLQLINGDPKHKANRYAEISEISRGLKHMARELNVVVIALSQLSRSVESRQDKRPMLSDLRESGQIEQDADVIALLYRDDYYDRSSKDKNTIEVIVGKNRNGPIGTVKLEFRKEFGKFMG